MKNNFFSKERVDRFCTVILAIIGSIFVKLVVDGAALVLKTGVVAMVASVRNLDVLTGQIPNYLGRSIGAIDVPHLFLEGAIIAFVLMALNTQLGEKRPELWKRIAFIVVSAVCFEAICFIASLVQFAANSIWAAVTSSAPSVTLRNNVSATRWANLDVILRLCEGAVMLRIINILKWRIRWQNRKVSRRRDREGA